MSDWRDDGQAAYEADLRHQQQEEEDALRRLAQTNRDDAEILARAAGHDTRQVFSTSDVFTHELFEEEEWS